MLIKSGSVQYFPFRTSRLYFCTALNSNISRVNELKKKDENIKKRVTFSLSLHAKKKNQCLLVIDVVASTIFNRLRGTPARISHASRSRQSYEYPPPPPRVHRHLCAHPVQHFENIIALHVYGRRWRGRALLYSPEPLSYHPLPQKMVFYYKINYAFSQRYFFYASLKCILCTFRFLWGALQTGGKTAPFFSGLYLP